MMNDNSLILSIDQRCDEAVSWLIERVDQAGLSVLRTFDLKDARDARASCLCPHHGSEKCDCQMVVLLVYSENIEPVSLIAHGNNSQTWFSVVDAPQQRADPRIEVLIRQIITQSLLLSMVR